MRLALVIRTRARDDRPLRLLDALAACDPAPAETVVVDSGSEPAVVDALARRPEVLLLRLAPGAYSSAGALNRGLAATRQPFVAVLSQDAWPVTRDYFARLASACAADRTAGAFARQLPGPAADPWTRKDLARTYPATREASRLPAHWFCNTCSLVRRGVWERFRFRESAGIVEDHDWGRRVIAAGYRVTYEPGACVEHHHDYRLPAETWRRFHAEGEGLAAIAGAPPSLWRGVRDCLREVASDARWLAARGQWRAWPAALRMRLVKHAALQAGGRAGRRE